MTLRQQLASGALLRWPGAYSPLVAMMIERAGFDGVYVSGAGLAADLGRPDTGLTTLEEVATRGAQIARATCLPAVIDADTGFDDPGAAVARFEESGLAGCHIEDQVPRKRCGHLDGKTLVSAEAMVERLRAARRGRTSGELVIIARTDARDVEGLDAALERSRRYVDAGADAIFLEALRDAKEIERARAALEVPLVINMTEFGKTALLSVRELSNLGVNAVLYPMTAMRLANHAIEEGLCHLRDAGSQRELLGAMQPRAELYRLLGYTP